MANRPRHLPTVPTVNPSRAAITAFVRPAAASRTILALITSLCGSDRLLEQVLRRLRSQAGRDRTTAQAQGIGGAP